MGHCELCGEFVPFYWGLYAGEKIYVRLSFLFLVSPVTVQLFLELSIRDINIDHSELTMVFVGIWSEQPLFGVVLAIYTRRML